MYHIPLIMIPVFVVGIAVVDNDTRLRHTALPSAAMSRGTQYDLWGLGNYQLLIRSHETARAAFGQVLDSRESHPRPESTPVIVRTKMEYIPKQGLEQVLAHAGCWLTASRICRTDRSPVSRVGQYVLSRSAFKIMFAHTGNRN